MIFDGLLFLSVLLPMSLGWLTVAGRLELAQDLLVIPRKLFVVVDVGNLAQFFLPSSSRILLLAWRRLIPLLLRFADGLRKLPLIKLIAIRVQCFRDLNLVLFIVLEEAEVPCDLLVDGACGLVLARNKHVTLHRLHARPVTVTKGFQRACILDRAPFLAHRCHSRCVPRSLDDASGELGCDVFRGETSCA